MSINSDIPGVAIQVSRDIVVASIQVDLDENVVARFQEDLLRSIYETGSRAVILDVSGLETIDSKEFGALRSIIRIAKVMGAESVLSGMRPGIVSALMDTDVDVKGLRAAINLDAAFDLIQAELDPPNDFQPEAELESQDESAVVAPGSSSVDMQEE
jgi:rsbT antagonist protein RsbS